MLPMIPEGIEPWMYYLCVGGAVLITGISKAGFGGGAGILAIPLMALVMGPTRMLGVMLPLLIACDVFANLHYIGCYDWSRLRWLLPGAAVGVVIGSIVLLVLQGMPPARFNQALSLIIGGVCLGLVSLQLYRLTGREVPTLPPHPASAASVGLVAGIVSTINHAAGPLVAIYLLQEKLGKRLLVGTLALYFLLINTAKLPTYLWLPMADDATLIHAGTLADSIWFIPLIPMGTLLGAWMNRRVPERPFALVMYVAAAATAGHMIWRAVLS